VREILTAEGVARVGFSSGERLGLLDIYGRDRKVPRSRLRAFLRDVERAVLASQRDALVEARNRRAAEILRHLWSTQGRPKLKILNVLASGLSEAHRWLIAPVREGTLGYSVQGLANSVALGRGSPFDAQPDRWARWLDDLGGFSERFEERLKVETGHRKRGNPEKVSGRRLTAEIVRTFERHGLHVLGGRGAKVLMLAHEAAFGKPLAKATAQRQLAREKAKLHPNRVTGR
jgi:hypothetical protein